MNPLLAFAQPKDILEVLEEQKKITHIDKLIIRYFDYPYPYHLIRRFFLDHAEYTHLIVYANDEVVKKEHIDMLIQDVLKWDFPLVTGVMNVDLDKLKDKMACCFEYPSLRKDQRFFNFIPLNSESGFIDCGFSGGVQCIRRDMLEKEKIPYGMGEERFNGESRDRGFNSDVVFAYFFKWTGVHVWADTRIQILHKRYEGEMLVHKKPPHWEFVPKL